MLAGSHGPRGGHFSFPHRHCTLGVNIITVAENKANSLDLVLNTTRRAITTPIHPTAESHPATRNQERREKQKPHPCSSGHLEQRKKESSSAAPKEGKAWQICPLCTQSSAACSLPWRAKYPAPPDALYRLRTGQAGHTLPDHYHWRL